MKLTSILATAALVGFSTFSDVPLKVINPSLAQVSAQQPGEGTSLTVDQKISAILANKGKPESAQMMREYFPKELTPIGTQPGGAGTVVNLYAETSKVTFSLCTKFDVVVAAKKGKIAKFPPAEVK
jgi:hypothetical protein